MKTVPAIPDPSTELLQRVSDVKTASKNLSLTTNEQRCKALCLMADSLSARISEIVKENLSDLQIAESKGLNQSLLARLKLDEVKLKSAIEGIRKVAKLSDPIGLVQFKRELDSELVLERVTVP